MILKVRRSEKSDILTPLYTYFRSKTNESDLTNEISAIQDMNDLRITIMQYLSYSPEAVNNYMIYYEYLDHLFYALPFGESIADLEFKWNDIYNGHQITTSNINVERGSILLNLASMYYLESYNIIIKGMNNIESITRAKSYTERSLSICSHIFNTILPILSGSPVPLELTSNGLKAIETFLNAFYYNLFALESNHEDDIEMSLCYIQRSFQLYSECINLVQQLPFASDSILQSLQFSQLYSLLHCYVIFIQYYIRGQDFTEPLPFALYQFVLNQLPVLRNVALMDDSRLKSYQALQRSVSELSNCKALQNSPEGIDLETLLSNIPGCEVDSPPPFSYVHQFAPLFDSLLPADVLLEINSLKNEYREFCSKWIYSFRGRIQDLEHNITTLNITSILDSVTEPRAFLINSISKVDVLQSSSDVIQLTEQFNNVKIMRNECIKRIEYLKTEVEKGLIEEQHIKAEHPTFVENTDYLNKIQKWLEDTTIIIQSKDEGLVMFSKSMKEYQKCSEIIHEKRKQLDTMKPLNYTQALQKVITQMKEKNKKMNKSIQNAERLVKKIEKLTVNDLSIRIFVRLGIATNKRNSIQMEVFSQVQNIVKEITEILNGVDSVYESVKDDCVLFEEELMQCDLDFDQRNLLESINASDRLLHNNLLFMNQTYPEFERLMELTHQLINDFGKYQQQIQEEIASYQDVQHTGEEMQQPPLSKSKSWICNICGIINDGSSMICDGCMNRRI